MEGIVGNMDPSYASNLLDYNKHTSNPDRYPNPFADPRPRPRMSLARARICAMNGDIINAGIWALSAFDPALTHIAELREHFAKLNWDDPIRVTIDRLASIYVEGQRNELLVAAGITTHEADALIEEKLEDVNSVCMDVVTCSSHPLAVEIMGYAMYLGVLTAHGTAPWRRFADVAGECGQQKLKQMAGI